MLEILERYYEEGLILKQVHPYLDLTIWNYSPKCQFDRLWDDITSQCRGLVTNSEGVVVARPFKKFKNYEEYLPEEIPNEPFQIFEKMDGSLGILFYYKTEWVLATRGSFTSPQAIRGKEILDAYDNPKYKSYKENLSRDYTFLFEIIYPENRIVVNYGGEEALYLITGIHTETGKELIYDDVCSIATIIGCRFVHRYSPVSDYGKIKEMISDESEGFVLLFKSGFRMKIKGDEYCRLHRILTGISNRDIWLYLKTGRPMTEILEKVPDEFYDWVRKTEKGLLDQFNTIKKETEDVFWTLINKKEFAEKAKKEKYQHFLFKRLNSYSTQFDEQIWDSIFPDYEKPFANKIIEDDL